MKKRIAIFATIALCFAIPMQGGVAKELTLDDIFPPARVVDVQITVAAEEWDKIRHQSRNFMTALNKSRQFSPTENPYTYVEASVTIDGVFFPKVGLRKKGFIGSQSTTRPSLKIKLNHFDKAGEIDGLRNLTLNNNKQDVSLVSQIMGYALFNAAGSPAPRCAYAKVTVNGLNLGIYSHVETMRKPLLKRAFGNSDGPLYEGTVVDFHEGWEQSFEHKRGDDVRGREKINQLIEVLAARDVTEDTIGELVDLDTFYRFWAVEGLIGFWDGYSGNNNNFFIYLNPDTDKFHFIPWGADSVFTKMSKLEFMNDARAPISVKTQGLIAHKLYQLESGRERYAAAMLALLEKQWDETAMLAEIDRISTMISPHLIRSQRRSKPEWNREARGRRGRGDDDVSYEDALQATRDFIRQRRPDIMKEISGGMPMWEKRPNPPFMIDDDGNFMMMRAKFREDTLIGAVDTGNLETIKRHIAQGADVNEIDTDADMQPLAWATLRGKVEVVELLLQHGADVNRKTGDGGTALHLAVFLGYADIAALLMKEGADVTLKNDDGYIASSGLWAPWDMTKFIMAIYGLELERAAVEAGRAKIAGLFQIDAATLPKSSDDAKDVWAAVHTGNLNVLKEVLADGFDVNAKNPLFGSTLLSTAALMGHTEVVVFLLDKGADVTAKNSDGGTALHSAAFLGRVETTKALLKRGADVHARSSDGGTPIEAATLDWGITQFILGMLKIEVDREEVEAGRAEVVALLSAHQE